jgi:hypothetical protein
MVLSKKLCVGRANGKDAQIIVGATNEKNITIVCIVVWVGKENESIVVVIENTGLRFPRVGFVELVKGDSHVGCCYKRTPGSGSQVYVGGASFVESG